MSRYWSLAFSLFLSACASTSRLPEPRLTQEYYPSRNGILQCRLPVGWINATTDAPSPDHLIWLVRSDDAAMLLVREVAIDEITRKEIEKSGLDRLGELMLSLASSENGAHVEKQPAPAVLKGISACTYEYVAGHPEERFHVLLVDRGARVYEVITRTADTKDEQAWRELIALQETFVQNVRW